MILVDGFLMASHKASGSLQSYGELLKDNLGLFCSKTFSSCSFMAYRLKSDALTVTFIMTRTCEHVINILW